jgi:hypothetical protein
VLSPIKYNTGLGKGTYQEIHEFCEILDSVEPANFLKTKTHIGVFLIEWYVPEKYLAQQLAHKCFIFFDFVSGIPEPRRGFFLRRKSLKPRILQAFPRQVKSIQKIVVLATDVVAWKCIHYPG